MFALPPILCNTVVLLKTRAKNGNIVTVGKNRSRNEWRNQSVREMDVRLGRRYEWVPFSKCRAHILLYCGTCRKTARDAETGQSGVENTGWNANEVNNVIYIYIRIYEYVVLYYIQGVPWEFKYDSPGRTTLFLIYFCVYDIMTIDITLEHFFFFGFSIFRSFYTFLYFYIFFLPRWFLRFIFSFLQWQAHFFLYLTFWYRIWFYGVSDV